MRSLSNEDAHFVGGSKKNVQISSLRRFYSENVDLQANYRGVIAHLFSEDICIQ